MIRTTSIQRGPVEPYGKAKCRFFLKKKTLVLVLLGRFEKKLTDQKYKTKMSWNFRKISFIHNFINILTTLLLSDVKTFSRLRPFRELY